MLGLGLGLHKNTFVGGGIDPNQAIINDFKARVLADGGTFEAEQCLKDSLPALIENEPSLAVTPNAKEAGKLFSITPTDGAGDLDVVRATTATYVDSDGLIKTALANEPRLDYTNGSCPSILVEPQRTNLILQSEEFDSLSWTTLRATVLKNTTISPTGNLTADTFNLSNVGQNQYPLFQLGITSSSLTNTFSIYVKYTNRRYIQLVWGSGFSTNFANFDLISGTITGGTYLDAKINNSYNGFFRISITTTGVSTNTIPYIWPIDTFNASRASTSDGIGSYILFGAQLEEGSNATSYIPTTTTTVTRNADVISKTGIADLIGQTEGSIYCEIDNIVFNQNSGIFVLHNNADQFNNRIGFRYSPVSLGALNAFIRTGTSFVVSLDGEVNVVGKKYKMCFTYNQTEQKFFINGVLVSSRTGSYTQPATLNQVQLGNMALNNFPSVVEINSGVIFKTVLTDTQAIQLTTL